MQADISCQFATLSVQNALYFRTKIVQNSSLNSLYLHLQSERKIIIDDELIFQGLSFFHSTICEDYSNSEQSNAYKFEFLTR